MELIDTHCHLTFEQLAGDVENVIARSIAAGVTGWITIGTDTQQSQKAVELANKFENMYAAVGIHPHYAKDVTADDIAELKRLAQDLKVVAIGETGLDFHYDFSGRTSQQRIFVEQLKIASEMNLPVIIHCREAFDETIKTLEQFGQELRKIVFHCFSSSAEQAKVVLARGWYISLTGVVTFKNANKTREAAKLVPVERLMIETDCPYMSPEPMRKQKVNEPALMIHTAKCIAELKNMDLDIFAQAVTATSRDFFNLPVNLR
jgi:TatD DNase family protein